MITRSPRPHPQIRERPRASSIHPGVSLGFFAAEPLSDILGAVPASFDELVEPMAVIGRNREDVSALQHAGRFYDRARLYLTAREFHQRAGQVTCG
jgi:hypothetical protein